MKRENLENSCKNYHPDIELNGHGNQDYGHNLADAIIRKKEEKYLEARADIEDARDFIETTNKHGLDPDDIFLNPYQKAHVLKECKGYKSLKTKGQRFKKGEKGTDFSKSSNAKIGLAFKSTYYSSLNKIEKYFGNKS